MENNPNPNLFHSNGFSVESSCPIVKGVPSERKCCGFYPTRFPYRSLAGTRHCCADKTYNRGGSLL